MCGVRGLELIVCLLILHVVEEHAWKVDTL